jgi:hypothetical protein
LTDTHDEKLLVSFLLGSLPPGEAERLDELSVSDDGFAAQLTAAENNLVDAYVRGELPADAEERFRSVYLSSTKRREKLAFAETFYSFQQRADQQSVRQQNLVQQKQAAGPAIARNETQPRTKPGRGWLFFTMPHLVPQWGFAGAAVVLLVASAYLATSNRQLRQQADRSEAERALLAQQEQQLQRELESGQKANSGTTTQNPQSSAEKPVDQLRIAAFVLAPTLRGAGALPQVSVSADTDLVVLKLELETSEFSRYRVSVVDATTRQALWHSADLKSVTDGDKQAVSFAFRKDLLKQRNYIVQVEGIQGNGDTELITSYPFRAVLK